MAAESARTRTQRTLRDARASTAIGQIIDSGARLDLDLSAPAAQYDFINFIIVSLNALNEVVVALATDVDNLRGA